MLNLGSSLIWWGQIKCSQALLKFRTNVRKNGSFCHVHSLFGSDNVWEANIAALLKYLYDSDPDSLRYLTPLTNSARALSAYHSGVCSSNLVFRHPSTSISMESRFWEPSRDWELVSKPRTFSQHDHGRRVKITLEIQPVLEKNACMPSMAKDCFQNCLIKCLTT